ncbi:MULTISPECIES: hypothetical protein [unclassified Microcoleus]
MSIISFDNTNTVQLRSLAPTLPCAGGATIIDRLPAMPVERTTY